MDGNIVITINRTFGSGGRTIGKMLAKAMDIPYYDREILFMASDESGINLRLFDKNDEVIHRNFFEPSVSKYTGDLIPPESDAFTSNKNIFNYQAKIIKELSKKQSCVIIGRCADFILKKENALNLFIRAPQKDCIKNLQEIEPYLSDEKALLKIKKINEHREKYYKYYTGKNWYNIENYDLSINSSTLGYEKTAELIESIVQIKTL
ncbi:AAA family ATPase [Filifactor alocis]|uniref:cytidylate kinase-like family protein n=1 Tax=Filifactor alocis TaxID=143361 RepID=UPI003F9F011F